MYRWPDAIPACVRSRFWPRAVAWYELEAAEDMVLVRVGPKGFDESEYEDEFVEAMEEFRKGLARGGEKLAFCCVRGVLL